MNIKQINTLVTFLLLVFIAVGSAYTTSKIDAQPQQNTKPVVAKNDGTNNAETSKSTYKEPKRISKDILK